MGGGWGTRMDEGEIEGNPEMLCVQVRGTVDDGSPKCPTLAVLRVAIDNLVIVINREMGGSGIEVWKFWKGL